MYHSIAVLKVFIYLQVLLLDSKIFLIENSRLNLINDLVRLSVFDYRSYILRPLKEFLLVGLKQRVSFHLLYDLVFLILYLLCRKEL